MVNACFFFLFHFLGWEGVCVCVCVRGVSQTGYSVRMGGGVHRIAFTHTPIKSAGIVRDSKKTGNHWKKWSFFYQLLNTECTPWSSLSFVAPVLYSFLSFFSFFPTPLFFPSLFLCVSLASSLSVRCISAEAWRRGTVFKAQSDSLLAYRRGSFSGFYSQTVGAGLKEMPSTSPLKHLSLPFSLATVEMISGGSHLLIRGSFPHGVLKNIKAAHSPCLINTHLHSCANSSLHAETKK